MSVEASTSLAESIASHAEDEGAAQTPMAGLALVRASRPMARTSVASKRPPLFGVPPTQVRTSPERPAPL